MRSLKRSNRHPGICCKWKKDRLIRPSANAQGWLGSIGVGDLINRSTRKLYTISATGRKHLDREVSSFEEMLEGIRHVLSPA